MDLTFSAFKLVIMDISKSTGASKPSEEAMKMMYDQVKTQFKEMAKESLKNE